MELDHKWLKEQDRQTYEELFRDNSYEVAQKDICGKNVLDIGANIGLFSLLCVGYGAKKIVAVEPIQIIYDQGLVLNTKIYPQIEPLNFAVWHTDNTTVRMRNLNVASCISETGDEVPTITLGSLLKEFPNDDNDIVLKIDCEGSEYDILMNIDKETMSRFGAVFIEIHGEANPKYKGIDLLKNKLIELGFKEIHSIPIVAFDDWTNDGGRVNERPLPLIVCKYRRSDIKTVLCSISTRGRYDTTLPLAIASVVLQTRKPDKFVLFDDSDKPKDLREIQHYRYLFQLLDEKSIEWEVIFGQKKGQHYNHQIANKMGYDLVWRLDDDNVAEPNVLEKLLAQMKDDVGAVGGSVLTPPVQKGFGSSKIDEIYAPNKQWFKLDKTEEVDHLHCSFLCRAGIVDYNLNLSRVAHREETLFTYELKKKGYKILVTPCITWHLKSDSGGIREGTATMFKHDEDIFQLLVGGGKLIVLDVALGDSLLFKSILSKVKEKYENITIACCFPEVFEGENIISITDAKHLVGNIDEWNPYKKANEWNHAGEFVKVFERMYL